MPPENECLQISKNYTSLHDLDEKLFDIRKIIQNSKDAQLWSRDYGECQMLYAFGIS